MKETKEEMVDYYFKKGDKRRGEALVIMALSYNGGSLFRGPEESKNRKTNKL